MFIPANTSAGGSCVRAGSFGFTAWYLPGVRLGRPRGIPFHVRERIVRERVEGATLQQIAERLNAETVPTASGQGRWHVSTVFVSALRQMEAR